MVKVGDVCPLFFSPVKDKFGLDMDYIQKFHASDKIHRYSLMLLRKFQRA